MRSEFQLQLPAIYSEYLVELCVSIFVLIKRENCQPINRKLMRLLTLLEFEAIIDKRRFQSGRKLPAIPFWIDRASIFEMVMNCTFDYVGEETKCNKIQNDSKWVHWIDLRSQADPISFNDHKESPIYNMNSNEKKRVTLVIKII